MVGTAIGRKDLFLLMDFRLVMVCWVYYLGYKDRQNTMKMWYHEADSLMTTRERGEKAEARNEISPWVHSYLSLGRIHYQLLMSYLV